MGGTHRLLDPPDVSLVLALAGALFLLAGLCKLSTRREKKEHGLDGLGNERKKFIIEGEEILEGQRGFRETERPRPLEGLVCAPLGPGRGAGSQSGAVAATRGCRDKAILGRLSAEAHAPH